MLLEFFAVGFMDDASHAVAGVNHVLKAVPADDRNANLGAYADPSLPLAPGVVSAIADFIHAHGG